MAKLKYRRVTGMQDVLADDQLYWRFVLENAQHVMDLFGFERIDTPILESTSLFKRGVGQGTDIVEKEMYTFEDRDGDSLALRPEFTAGVMRAYIENGMHTQPSPLKLWTTGPLFRHERNQKGRYRQHSQFNLEILGETDAAVDAELINVAWFLFSDLGMTDLHLHLNSTGCPVCKPAYIEKLTAYFQSYESILPEDDKRRLRQNPLRILDSKEAATRPLLDDAPQFVDYLCEDCADHFGKLRTYLKAQKIPYQIDHKLVRGLDYYTKTVFEIKAPGSLGAQDVICGGGRYDGLIETLGGRATPGIGFGSGIERIVLTLKAQNVEPPRATQPIAFIAYLGEAAKVAAIQLTAQLRDADLLSQMSFGDRSLKAQLKSANRAHAKFAIIIGEEELAKGMVTIRELETKTQNDVPFPEIITHISG